MRSLKNEAKRHRDINWTKRRLEGSDFLHQCGEWTAKNVPPHTLIYQQFTNNFEFFFKKYLAELEKVRIFAPSIDEKSELFERLLEADVTQLVE